MSQELVVPMIMDHDDGDDDEEEEEVLTQPPPADDDDDDDDPAPPDPEPQIQIKVVDSMGGETYMKLRPDTPMRKLFKAYAVTKGTSLGGVRFMFDGRRLAEDDTPRTLDMEDGDAIDALAEQTGG